MHRPVDEDDRNLVGVTRRQSGVVVQRQLDPFVVGLGAHGLDDLPGHIAQMAARFADQNDPSAQSDVTP